MSTHTTLHIHTDYLLLAQGFTSKLQLNPNTLAARAEQEHVIPQLAAQPVLKIITIIRFTQVLRIWRSTAIFRHTFTDDDEFTYLFLVLLGPAHMHALVCLQQCGVITIITYLYWCNYSRVPGARCIIW
jgi:hypothetical protein